MLEKREWRRIDVKLAATAKLEANSRRIKVEVLNINPQGLCFSCDKEFSGGDKIDLSVELQGSGMTRLLTEVTWSGYFEKEKRFMTGVKVITADQEEREKFIKFYNVKLLYSIKPD